MSDRFPGFECGQVGGRHGEPRVGVDRSPKRGNEPGLVLVLVLRDLIAPGCLVRRRERTPVALNGVRWLVAGSGGFPAARFGRRGHAGSLRRRAEGPLSRR